MLLFLAFTGIVYGQYYQRWNWVPEVDAQGQPILTLLGTPIFKPQWRPDHDPGTPWKDVQFTRRTNVLPNGIELECVHHSETHK
jgi:hypothetical protein